MITGNACINVEIGYGLSLQCEIADGNELCMFGLDLYVMCFHIDFVDLILLCVLARF